MGKTSEKNVSFYPAIGRAGYNVWKDLPPEERTKKENRPKFRKLSTLSMSLEEVFRYITNPNAATGHSFAGTCFSGEKPLSLLTEELRSSPDYKIKKIFLLDNVVFGGIPAKKEETKKGRDGNQYTVKTQRKKANFSEKEGAVFSGYVVIDLDHLESQGIDIRRLRDELSKDPEIGLQLLFTSPSGDGLKLICKSKKGYNSPLSYEREYNSLVEYLSKTLRRSFPGFDVDTSGKDISRTCFLCYDPDAILFDTESEFDSDLHPAPVKEIKRSLYSGPTFSGGDDGIDELVERVEASGVDIAPSYKEYWPLVCSFSALGERGRSYLHRVCSLSPKYSPEDTDFDFDNVPDEPQNVGYFVNLCKASGIDVKRAKKAINNDIKECIDKSLEMENKPLKYANRIALPKDFSLWEEMSLARTGMEIPYHFGTGEDRQLLRIPREGVTMICGLSSHGKSTFLRNLAVQIATSSEEGDVLYISYEENKGRVLASLLSIYVGEELNRGNNLSTLRDFSRSWDDSFISEGKKSLFHERVREFQALCASGRLRVYDGEDTSKELVSFLNEYQSQRKVKAVFVDYIQRLKSGEKNISRTDDIKTIAEDLQDFAKKAQVPVVVAAQLNRLTSSPLKMGANNIAESADLTRNADLIVCLWNSTKKEDVTDDKFNSSELESRGFILGAKGTIYAKITKDRAGESGLDAVLRFNGKTGVISDEEDTNKTSIWGE